MIFLWNSLVFSLAAQDEHGLRRAQQILIGVGTRGRLHLFDSREPAFVGVVKGKKAQGTNEERLN